jgi:hypothetical protein
LTPRSTITVSSNCSAKRTPASSSSGVLTFFTPTLDPPTLGLTNTGKGSLRARLRKPAGAVSISRRVTASYSTTGTPAAAIWRLNRSLSMARALAVTPGPT